MRNKQSITIKAIFAISTAIALCAAFGACDKSEDSGHSVTRGVGGSAGATGSEGGVAGFSGTVAGSGGAGATAGAGGKYTADGGGPGIGGRAGVGGSAAIGTGGSAGSGGKGASGDGGLPCDGCTSYSIAWGYIGGMVRYTERSTLASCFKYTHQRNPTNTEQPSLLCEREEPMCDSKTAIGSEQVAVAIQNADVQAALAKGAVLYGRDNRPVDAPLFEIQVGTNTIQVGDDCSSSQSGCVPVPKGIQTLVDLLKKLDEQQLAKAPCNTTFTGS